MAVGSFKDRLEIDILKAITGQATTILTTTPLPGGLWLGLCYTTSPTDVDITGEGTEPTIGTNGYARVNTVGLWGAPAAGRVSNNAAINFAPFTGTIAGGAFFVAFALYDQAAAGTGHQLAWGQLSPANKTGNAGDTMQFPIGSLIITAD